MADSSYRDIDQRIEDMLRPRGSAAAGPRATTDAQIDTTLVVGRIGRLEAEIAELRSTLARLEPKLDKAAGLADTSAANLVTFVVYGALGGFFFLFVAFLQISMGYSPIAAGAATLPVTVLMLLLSARSGALAQR